MNKTELFDRLWRDYAEITPSAAKVRALLSEKDGAPVANDHIAFRTFDRGPVDLESFVAALGKVGYEKRESYDFPAKKLRAHHFECEEDDPKIFVSELLTENFSSEFRAIVDRLVDRVPRDIRGVPALLLATEAWPDVSWTDYERLLSESEYGGWLAAFRIRANHFTVAVHRMKKIGAMEKVVALLRGAGFPLNESGGVIKGNREEMLEQASTLGDRMPWRFAGGELHTIPTCYYEFALRYRQPDGRFFPGFIAKSADKIFESTNRR